MCGQDAILITQDVKYIVIPIESVVLITSLIAAFLHKGFQRKSKALLRVNPTTFHWAHAGFVAIYIITHVSGWIIETGRGGRETCICDPINVLWVVQYFFFSLYLGIFSRLWMRTLASETKFVGFRRVGLGLIMFSALGVIYLERVFSRPCATGALPPQFLTAWMLLCLALCFDTSRVAFASFKSWRMLKAENVKRGKSRFGRADAEMAAFAALPISLLVGTVVMFLVKFDAEEAVGEESRQDTNTDKGLSSLFFFGQIFLYVVPSSATLFIMWDRHYAIASEDNVVELEWESTHAESSRLRMRAAQLNGARFADSTSTYQNEADSVEMGVVSQSSTIDVSLLYGENKMLENFDELKSDVIKDLRSLLVKATHPLKSKFEIKYTPPGDAEKEPEHEMAEERILSIEEQLTPSKHTFYLAARYVRDIVLPVLERTVALHNDKIGATVSASQPASSVGTSAALTLGDLETVRQYERIKHDGEECISKAVGMMCVMQAVRVGMSAAGLGNQNEGAKKTKKSSSALVAKKALKAAANDAPLSAVKGDELEANHLVFKPSTQKKVANLAVISTNCQVHTTSFRFLSSKGEAERNSSGGENSPFLTVIVSVTFGAPAAHAMGFKKGGLRELTASYMELQQKQAQLQTRAIPRSTSVDMVPEKPAVISMGRRASRRLGSLFSPSSADTNNNTSGGAHNEENPHETLVRTHLEFEVRARQAVVLSQALGAAVTASVELLTRLVIEHRTLDLQQCGAIGLLLHSACLLTTSGNEEAMLNDFAGAYDLLNLTLRFEPPVPAEDDVEAHGSGGVKLTVIEALPCSNNATNADRQHQHGGVSRHPLGGLGNVVVVVRVAPLGAFEFIQSSLSQLPATKKSGQTPEIHVVPVLFNLGVNEMQTVANATGSTSSQTEINERGVQHLKAYHRSFVEFIASASLTGGSKHPFSQSFADLPKLLSELEEMVEGEARHRGKDVEMLLTSCTIARLMNGARTTSCKSAKDRTSVFHSLEVARLAQRFGIVNPSQEQALLDDLRGPAGVRLKNCEDNTGRPKYAFNQIQLQALPSELRPPASTAAAWGVS